MAESVRITLVALFFFRMCIGGDLVDDIDFDILLVRAVTAILPGLFRTQKYMKQFWAEIAARIHQFIGGMWGGLRATFVLKNTSNRSVLPAVFQGCVPKCVPSLHPRRSSGVHLCFARRHKSFINSY